ncbi:Phage protein [Paenibacillus pasadenensis]|uniref:Phage protein n=1 Tax=Paenibacillus pasadenensis TaxID=217090 RepID=A0A2N5NCI8_9BACL|nr:Phage protein [Paenibacillus pasadenensis]
MDYILPFPIGAVKIINVFEYFDGPKVFACESITGQKYMVNWIDTNSNSDTWFYVPVSGTRYLLILNGKVSLRDCILHSENKLVLEVRTPKGQDNTVEINYRELSSIVEEELPDPDSFLELDQQAPTLPPREDTTMTATRSGRDVLDISLNVSDQHSNEIDAELLGEVLITTQNLAYYVGSNTTSSRGPVARDIINANKLKASGFFAASFGVRLKSDTVQGLFGDTDASSTLEKLMELFEATPEEEKFRTVVKGLSIRAIKSYYTLLNKLDNEDTRIKVEWASPNQKYKEALLDSGNIKKAIDILIKETKTEVKQIEVKGILVGVNTDSNKFYLHAEDDEHISGIIGDSLRDQQFVVPVKVKALVEQKTEIHVFTEEEKTTYTLITLE